MKEELKGARRGSVLLEDRRIGRCTKTVALVV
jgi:hypothetical protein